MDGLENSLTVSLTESLVESLNESTYNRQGNTVHKKRRNRQHLAEFEPNNILVMKLPLFQKAGAILAL